MRPLGIVLIIVQHLENYIMLRPRKLTLTLKVIYDKNFRHCLAGWLAGWLYSEMSSKQNKLDDIKFGLWAGKLSTIITI